MFNRAALGYFSHMWELYAFWAFVPTILLYYRSLHAFEYSVPMWSFAVIAIGGLGCVTGGKMSQKIGSGKVAFLALAASATCCCLSFFFFNWGVEWFFVTLCVWGFFVVMDSPQFSSLVAKHADPKYLGSSLTIVNSIGFAITIVSIELLGSTTVSGRRSLLGAGSWTPRWFDSDWIDRFWSWREQ